MDIPRIKNFLAEDHQKIEGWFFPLDQLIFYELVSIQNSLEVRGDFAEIGVFRGKSLVFLSLLKSETQRLFGFDLFDGDLQKVTEDNLVGFGSSENVILKKGFTSDLSRAELDHLLDRPLRFLHIDAGHEYHEVLQQLELFTPYVREDAVIAMDDYQDREFPGIEAAVLDFAERDRPRRFVPFLAGGNKMFLCASNKSSALQKIVAQLPNFKDKCRLTRVRDFNILLSHSKLPVPSEKIVGQLDQFSFPQRAESLLSRAEQAATYSQIEYGSGARSIDG